MNIKTLGTESLVIWLTFALLATGVEIGGSFQPTRIMSILLLFISLRLMRIRKASMPTILLLIIFFSWFFWGIISLFWAPDINAGTKELIGVGLGLVLVFSLMFLVANRVNVLNAVRVGWMTAFMLTVPIAAWELITNQHLASAVGSNMVGGANPFLFNSTSVTFGNRNTYVTFITVAFPFLLWGLNMTKTWMSKLFYYFLILAAMVLIFLNASRLGIFTIGLYLFFWILSMLFPKGLISLFAIRGRSFVRAIFIALMIGVVFFQVWQNTPLTRMRLNSVFSGEDQSTVSRIKLIENGFYMLKNTFGMGVGAGGFESSILTHPQLYIGSELNPHNLILEVFAQYGLIIGGLFLAWLGYCFAWILAAQKVIGKLKPIQENIFYKNMVFTGFLLLIGFPLYTSINSSFITFTFFWATVASVALIASTSYQIAKNLK